MAKCRWYVGLKAGNRHLFCSTSTPTERSYGRRYGAVIGPFRTKAGASCMAKYGGAHNPHLRNVSDAERMARQGKC